MTAERRGAVRVQKILSEAGIASRRAAENLILEGRVTRNGETVSLGDRALPGQDALAVDGVPVGPAERRAYYAVNKPRGVLSSASDPEGRKTVLELLPGDVNSRFRLFPVGRLDMDSTGLILLTNDGFLAYRLTHPSFEVPRQYVVEVEPPPSAGDLGRLRKGVRLEEGEESGPARVSLVSSAGGRGVVRFTIHTGLKRQVRRSFEALGYRVRRLDRVRFGSLGLGHLRPGSHRELTPMEVKGLYRATGWREQG